jgi:transcriptional regulator with XRE-family HTH domain
MQIRLRGFLTESRRLGYPWDMASVYAEEAIRVRRDAGLSDVIIGEATGAKPSTVRDWFSGRSSPTGSRARRLAELVEITDRLARVVEPRYIPLWLIKPVEALDDHRPVDVIARGQARRVAKLVSGLEYPGAA